MRRLATAAGVLAVLTAAACTSSTTGDSTSTKAASPTGTATPPIVRATSTPPRTSSTPPKSPSSPRSSTASAAPGPTGGPVPDGFTPESATFVSAEDGWVLGGTGQCTSVQCTAVLRTRDGGQSWRGIPAPKAAVFPDVTDLRDGGAHQLRFADVSNGWAAGPGLYATHDGGAHWHEIDLHAQGAVAAIETGGGYAYATVFHCPSQGSSTCAFTTTVYATPVGTDDWRPLGKALPGGGTAHQLVVHGADWFVATDAGVFHGHGLAAPTRLANPCPTRDGERAAPALALADAQHLDALCMSRGGAGSAQYQLYGTNDGGRTWQRAGDARTGPSDLYGIADNAAGVLLAAASSGGSELLRSTNDGASFSDADAPTPTGGLPWSDLGFTTADQALAVLARRAMYLSRDAGKTFQRVTFG